MKGGFGNIYQVRNIHNGKLFAMKCAASKRAVPALLNEIAGLADIGYHPNLISMTHVTVVEGRPVFFMPWAEGGKLRSWLPRRSLCGCRFPKG